MSDWITTLPEWVGTILLLVSGISFALLWTIGFLIVSITLGIQYIGNKGDERASIRKALYAATIILAGLAWGAEEAQRKKTKLQHQKELETTIKTAENTITDAKQQQKENGGVE